MQRNSQEGLKVRSAAMIVQENIAFRIDEQAGAFDVVPLVRL